MVDYSNYKLRQKWQNYKPKEVKRRSPAPFLLVALAAVIVSAVTLVLALPDNYTRITVNAAYIEHNGERVNRPQQIFDDIDPSQTETFTRIIGDYTDLCRALVRITYDLDRGLTSPSAAVALIRNHEAVAMSALVALHSLTDGEIKTNYTAAYLYAAHRLEQLSQNPCADTVWQTAKDLWTF